MIDVLPKCKFCGSYVSDFVEPEIKKEGEIKPGNYINSEWVCNNCNKRTEPVRTASVKDVSPNTPMADNDSIDI